MICYQCVICELLSVCYLWAVISVLSVRCYHCVICELLSVCYLWAVISVLSVSCYQSVICELLSVCYQWAVISVLSVCCYQCVICELLSVCYMWGVTSVLSVSCYQSAICELLSVYYLWAVISVLSVSCYQCVICELLSVCYLWAVIKRIKPIIINLHERLSYHIIIIIYYDISYHQSAWTITTFQASSLSHLTMAMSLRDAYELHSTLTKWSVGGTSHSASASSSRECSARQDPAPEVLLTDRWKQPALPPATLPPATLPLTPISLPLLLPTKSGLL